MDNSPSPSSLDHLAFNTTVKDILSTQKRSPEVIYLQDTDTLKGALQVLHDNEILSAPIVHATLKNAELKAPLDIGTIVGLVDVLDITGFILNEWERKSVDSPGTPFDKDSQIIREEIFQTSITSLINFSSMNPPVTISEAASVSQLIKVFSDVKPFQQRHRVLVLNSSNHVINIISQSDLIEFLGKRKVELPNGIEMKTIKELGLVHASLMVPVTTSCYDALDILYRNRASGIAVVNHKGELSTNFSASDLRGITPDSFDYFHEPVIDFLLKGTDTGLGEPITCTETTSLVIAMQILNSNRIHRIYVVNPRMQPIGVVTLTDIIRLFRVQVEA